MIFDLTANSGKPKKLPVLNASYPANTSPNIHKSTGFRVVIAEDGYPAEYSYQWYKNGVAISGATGSTYTYKPTKPETATFYCKVTNAAGTVTSRSATMTATKLYLYNSGDQCTDITGGWTTVGTYFATYYGNNGTPILTVNDDSLVGSNTNGSTGYMGHKNTVDMTPYTTVHLAGNITHNSGQEHHGYCCPVVLNEGTTDWSDNLAAGTLTAYGSFTDLQIDITNVDQAALVGWGFYSWGSGTTACRNTVELTKVWLT